MRRISFCIAISIPLFAEAADGALQALQRAKALTCEFAIRIETLQQGDSLKHRTDFEKRTLMFDSIEYPRNRARLITNYRTLGPSANEVEVFWSASGITLIEGKEYRNHSFTTVFPVLTRDKRSFFAVHSVHTLDPTFPAPNGPAQAYGTCQFSP